MHGAGSIRMTYKMNTGKTKTCYVCKKKKGRSAFQKDRSQPDGLQRRCRKYRNGDLTLKALTGVHGGGKLPDFSDLTPGPYKEDAFESIFRRIFEIECESDVSKSHKTALKSAALQLLVASKENSYTHPVYGTMSIENGKLKIQFSDNLEAPEHDE